MLTLEEFSLISDQSFLKQKRLISDKISKTFGEVEVTLKGSGLCQSPLLPDGSLIKSGKISKGENYKGLPYIVLDFPRFSDGKKLLIYRTMFWWGNYCLCMLISQNCGHRLSVPPSTPYLLNIGDTPWNYDLSDPNWIQLNQTSIPSTLPFLSIARKVDFSDFDQLSDISRTTFETVLSFLNKKN